MPGFPQGRALVIGVGAYADPGWNAPTAARDALGLEGALVDPDGAAYARGAVEALVDGRATRDGVLAALGRLANSAGPDSVALVSFTCHGAEGTDGAYYLATADARFTRDKRVVAGSGLASFDLARALRDIQARHLLLIVNACFSGRLGADLGAGGLAPDGPRGAMLPDEAGRELVSTGEGRAVITAARAGQLSYYGDDREYTFFGQALIDAFRGIGVGRAGGAIGLFELYDSLYAQVRGAVRRELSADQEPALTLLQGVGPFAVAGAAAREGDLRQRPQDAPPAREVPPITVNVTNKRSVISFDGATIMGNVRTGHVVEGDLTIIGGERAAEPEDEPVDPASRLPVLRARVEVARNVPVADRDDAVALLRLAERALRNGNPGGAGLQIEEALKILRAMNNGYVNSVVRKLEAVAGELANQ